MFDWVPLKSYTSIYYFFCLLVIGVVSMTTLAYSLRDQVIRFNLKVFIFTVFIIVLLYMGMRPVSGVFTDMTTYAGAFKVLQSGADVKIEKDYLFNYFMKWCSAWMSVQSFFFVCASIYVIPIYFVCRKWFGNYWYYAFLLVVTGFSFWAYGTNTIRNGMAGSVFLLGISRRQWLWRIILIIIAVNIHKTMMLPTVAYLLATLYPKPKLFLYFWLACIPISLLSGMFFQNLLAGLVEDERASYLTDGNVNNDQFRYTGFRWDFLLYSASAVLTGAYYIFKKNYKDSLYLTIYCTYLFSNAVWILVIRANFSDRFAYLSWFIMAFVFVYPLSKHRFFEDQNKVLAYTFIIYFAFTFFMNVIL